ncbi:hypothetical protein TTHERM_00670280 (macronuclear) [Tetrahymena thermophila SB210]|uniref:Uncharacterized protein n=1 Tax=Tetrahymena thermophila (strain SB210) TaxID=312017 RepID=I7MJA6_TETTS|nr:hypothetical protein TTHERM_00670280 [Tetrahymena thermophila SB210]EAS06104.3 hypothetical protein TTHERM_00670280 [Tetrahymena thermophila SB210]|eukprot:XP_001026349.3 hypothetical protein TTHERM_00670280 [Tetrahymena thermophila SB210]
MGCVQSAKPMNRKSLQIEQNMNDCSIQVAKKRYNPDLMKNGCQAAELNDFSLCATDKKRGNYDDIDDMNEFDNSFDDEKNTNSSKSEEQQDTKQVIPAQMQINWQLQNNIGESSLLQRRFINNKLKINSNCEIACQ